MHDAFFLVDGPRFQATPLTRGPWDDRFQHGGPPAALLASTLASYGDDADEFDLARLWFEFIRAVPIAACEITVEVEHAGRASQRLAAMLHVDGRPAMRARGLRIRRQALDLPEGDHQPPPWPDPEGLEPFVFPFFKHEVGYHRAVELKVAEGAWGRTPVGFWGRPTVPLVAGRPLRPLEALVILADAQSGMGVPLDPLTYSFANPDLTIYFERNPTGRWFGLDIRSRANEAGFGLAQSAIRDEVGWVARAAQALIIR